MSDLRALFEALGHKEVATYVQSGNVVFKARGDAASLARAIERRIARDLGLDVAVILRSKAQLARIAAGNPFARREPEPTRLHVTFLADTPARGARARAQRRRLRAGRVAREGERDLPAHAAGLRPDEAQRRILRAAARRRHDDAQLAHRHEAHGAALDARRRFQGFLSNSVVKTGAQAKPARPVCGAAESAL
jgi:uncharacterized protein (DUF1697 family)